MANFSGHAKLWPPAFLIAITLFAYAPVWHHGFINFDDPEYVTNNRNVTAGLTWEGVKWAFATGEQANWHPLTWLSHMLDVQLFGLNAGAHHAVNVFFHLASTLLLFWILLQITGAPGCSTFIASLFAVHPLHVESVAWVAERKDVLSTLLWMLTLCAYVRYARRPRPARYWAVIGFFALGLMAKPMLVTLPFVLLLLDFWPLRRSTLQQTSSLPSLIREKIPLFVLTLLSSIVTFFAQRNGGVVMKLAAIPLTTRLANAFVVYIGYIQKMFWPTQLAVLYPVAYTAQARWWAAALAVIGLSILSVWLARFKPYIAIGWFWFLGTLIPVIGLVQVGHQAMADRYTYVPLIGLFIILAFGLADIFAALPERKRLLPIAGGLAIGLCIWQTRAQLQYWTSSQALWAHTLSLTTENPVAEFNLATALQDQGKLDEAITHYSEAVRIDEKMRDERPYLSAQYNWGYLLMKSGEAGKAAEAAKHLAEAIRGDPNFADAHNALGIDYLVQGKVESAITELSEAIRLNPGNASAHNNLATAFANRGNIDSAISEYREALRLQPDFEDAHVNLGILLAKQATLTGKKPASSPVVSP